MKPIPLAAVALAAFFDLSTPAAAQDAGCLSDLDGRIKAIRADAALSPGERQAAVDALWRACAPQLDLALRGAIRMSTQIAAQAATRPATPAREPEEVRAARRAALQTLWLSDPDQRVTMAIVGAASSEP